MLSLPAAVLHDQDELVWGFAGAQQLQYVTMVWQMRHHVHLSCVLHRVQRPSHDAMLQSSWLYMACTAHREVSMGHTRSCRALYVKASLLVSRDHVQRHIGTRSCVFSFGTVWLMQNAMTNSTTKMPCGEGSSRRPLQFCTIVMLDKWMGRPADCSSKQTHLSHGLLACSCSAVQDLDSNSLTPPLPLIHLHNPTTSMHATRRALKTTPKGSMGSTA